MRYTFGARSGERLAYLFASAVAHGVAVFALQPRAPIRLAEDEPDATLIIETVREEPVPPEVAPPPPDPPAPPPDEPQLAAAAPPDATEPEAPDVEPPAIDAPDAPLDPGPMDLTGTVLTASGSGAAMKVAGTTGTARKKKGKPGPRQGAGPATTAASSAGALQIVPLEDLSRAPSPPALDGALARLYPPEARREGRAGSAAVRALVAADGRIRSATISSASDAAFGAACQQLVVGSTWSPPLDGAGKPVATWVRYTCRFQIDR